jgi:23S rRNA pseudouridine1911/1915/1917 synthase
VDDLSGIGGEKRPGIVHRLDRGTSGLMVVAKRRGARGAVAAVCGARGRKEYIALVWGEVMAGRASTRRLAAIRRTGKDVVGAVQADAAQP